MLSHTHAHNHFVWDNPGEPVPEVSVVKVSKTAAET